MKLHKNEVLLTNIRGGIHGSYIICVIQPNERGFILTFFYVFIMYKSSCIMYLHLVTSFDSMCCLKTNFRIRSVVGFFS